MASRYWVGGDGVWDATSTTHWSATSGGTGGASVPSITDDVYFDNASSSDTYTVTVEYNIDSVCHDLIIDGPNSGSLCFESSQYHTGIVVYGNLSILGDNNNIDFVSSNDVYMQMVSTVGISTIDTNGVYINGILMTIQDPGSVKLLSDLIIVVKYGSEITLWNLNDGDFDCNSKTVTIKTDGHAYLITPLTLYNLVVEPYSSTPVSRQSYFQPQIDIYLNEYLVYGNETPYTSEFIKEITTLTIENQLTINGNSKTDRVLIKSDIMTSTITSKTNSINAADFANIIGEGNANWDLSSATNYIGDYGTNSGITCTSSVAQSNTVVDNFDWNTASNWTSRVPLPQDEVTISGDFQDKTITLDYVYVLGKNVNMTGITNSESLTLDGTKTYELVIIGDFTANAFKVSSNLSLSLLGIIGSTNIINMSHVDGYLLHDININYYQITSDSNYEIIGDLACSGDFRIYGGSVSIDGTIEASSSFSYNIDSLYLNTSTLEVGGMFISLSGNSIDEVIYGKDAKIIITDYRAQLTKDSEIGILEFKDNNESYLLQVPDHVDGTNNPIIHELILPQGNGLYIDGVIDLETLSVDTSAGNVSNFKGYNSTAPGTINVIGDPINVDYLNISYLTITDPNSFYAGSNSTDSGHNVFVNFFPEPTFLQEINDSMQLTAYSRNNDNDIVFGHDDYITLSDNSGQDITQEISRSIEDTISTLDNISSGFLKDIIDTVSLSDSSDAIFIVARELDDTVSIADSLSTVSTYERVIDDTISTADGIEQLKASYRDFNESVIITDNIIVSANYIRTIADTISMSESISARKQSADVWKSIVAMKINIGGQWTDLF